MKDRIRIRKLIPIYAAVIVGCICTAYFCSRTVTVTAENLSLTDRTCIIIDAGHGGIDGGATSCSGVMESQLNLEISLRLNDLLHFLGYDTRMIRTTDTSIYTDGKTIASQKISDLKERVRIVNETHNAILVSIHQNTFSDSRYSGAQVFYGKQKMSKNLAEATQALLVKSINPGSKRQCKPSDGIYLMQNIEKPGILIECGFLSNAKEDAMLQTSAYQNKIVCVIASALSCYITNT